MSKTSTVVLFLLLANTITAQEGHDASSDSPLPEARVADLLKSFEKSLSESAKRIQSDPTAIDAYSRHGDASFFLGRFTDAVADYDKMNQLDETQSASHWRRGIALFYAGKYKDAASQFESYHSFDQVDRENGIWRYLSQHKAYGREKAREGLLKYQKDDREPFPSVYKLFAGTISAEEILKSIAEAEITKVEREQRLFYAHLYIGLNHAVEGESVLARTNLAAATRNNWASTAGYGPAYMWHVGRLHEDILRKKAEK